MAQNQNILQKMEHYTRADYTALRAVMHKMPLETILDLYYCEDDREALSLYEASDLRRRLNTMRDILIARATDTNPHVAKFLSDARETAVWSKAAISALVNAADEKMFAPRPSDRISWWLKPRVAQRLKAENCVTLDDLASLINRRGSGWNRSIPRVGDIIAGVIERWFNTTPSLGGLVDEKRLSPAFRISTGDLIPIDCNSPRFAPMDVIAVPAHLDGHDGINRCRTFCMISARTDLDAAWSYVKGFEAIEQIGNRDGEPIFGNVSKTYRSYLKEVERFVLWCIKWQRKPLSSIVVDDCEDYKRFLATIPSSWQGKRTDRYSSDWRPFYGQMSPQSQRYAVRALRQFFNYLVDVRYLYGNPWRAVKDPKTVIEIEPIQIGKALSQDLWRKLANEGGILDWYCAMSEEEIKTHFIPYGVFKKASMQAQMRLVRAAIVLMGETGLRREEAASATRNSLSPPAKAGQMWRLVIVGKRRKKRMIPVPARVIEVVRAHWTDRTAAFDYGMEEVPLLSPVILPPIKHARDKHLVTNRATSEEERRENPFTADGMGKLVSKSLERIAKDTGNPYLTADDRAALLRSAAHALRHTFGTNAIADKIPIDVVQSAMGHESLQTTTLYVRAQQERMLSEFARRQERKATTVSPIEGDDKNFID